MICLVWPSVSWRKIDLKEVPLKRKKPLVANWPQPSDCWGKRIVSSFMEIWIHVNQILHTVALKVFMDRLLLQFCYRRIEIAIGHNIWRSSWFECWPFPPWFQFRRWCSALFWPRKRWRFPVRHCTGTSQTKVELKSSVASCAVVFTRHQVA